MKKFERSSTVSGSATGRGPGLKRRAVAATTWASALAIVAGAIGAPAASADEAAPRGALCTSEARPELATELSTAIEKIAAPYAGDVAVGVSAFGGDLECGYWPDKGFDAASSGKVLVLTTLLRMADDEGRTLTAAEKELARAMIRVSDNDATVKLRDMVGRERMQKFIDDAGMSNTTLHERNAIGLMKITTTDELTLLNLITGKNPILSDTSRNYAKKLMNTVVADQKWGVTAGAPAGTKTYVKNGWLPYDGTNVWRVNSVGFFIGAPAGTYQVVVLTDQNKGMQAGVTSIEKVAAKIHTVVNGSSTSVTPFSEPERIDTRSDGSDQL